MQRISEWWLGLSRQRQVVLGGVSVLLLSVVFGGWLLWGQRPVRALPATVPQEQTQQSSHATSKATTEVSGTPHQVSSHDTRVFVDVQGAVAHPGLYQFSAEMRVADAIKAAGGLTGKADRKQINLASRLTDQQQLQIPLKGETVQRAGNQQASSSASGVGNRSAAKADGKAATVVNLNTATVSDLQQLTGIGEKKAQKIVDYRTAHGSFQTVKDLTQVPGFGEKTVENLQDQLTT
ncbi:helix-hairpin-helix domain-containing protein [Levilactobacillus tujiorum]|uniref:DNA-binding protein n=1 Tax=Levilactobacillus tujiorum TaxID=2912243 RepID=A0ABX1L4N9_9LACO|nr:helix-hairpin-helix domain-containing protein [Levilactobacillus tujiorum]MCH5464320.1 helix-hairpin-helix domain-containing protein [Levilactobacillus tujiorum]NLR11245.1 DNA-binding protein [Lactobacillus sp. HBUAS51387]NLR29301.1 DNA-binding protein [Levilactobacillus tujiorum]